MNDEMKTHVALTLEELYALQDPPSKMTDTRWEAYQRAQDKLRDSVSYLEDVEDEVDTTVRAWAEQAVAPFLSPVLSDDPWCLVRWAPGFSGDPRPFFCGPLSPVGSPELPAPLSGLGFPKGRIGTVLWFPSAEEARERSPDPRDVPTRASELAFWAEEFSHYDGSTGTLVSRRYGYEGYVEAQTAVALAERARSLGVNGQRGTFKASVKCEPVRKKLAGEVGPTLLERSPPRCPDRGSPTACSGPVDSVADHVCPYSSDLDGDETPCLCCESCAGGCADEL